MLQLILVEQQGDDFEDDLLACVGLVYYGLEEARQLSILRRSSTRLYLTRPNLLPLMAFVIVQMSWVDSKCCSPESLPSLAASSSDYCKREKAGKSQANANPNFKIFQRQDPQVSGDENTREKGVYI